MDESTWRPSTRVPDPAVRELDPRFAHYRLAHAKVERLGGGLRWAEGPAWFADGRFLLFTDLPNDRIMRWDEATGVLGVFRQPSDQANGMTRDRQGRLLVCEHGGRRVTRTDYDGSITVLADSYAGKPLNSPNDIVVKSDDSIWFTDPPFGLVSDYMGRQGTPSLPANLYRLDRDGTLNCVAEDIEGPNGLAFSPDETTLYLVESRARPRRIVAYDVNEQGDISNRRLLIDAGTGLPDGLRVDVDGNLWCGWGAPEPGLDGVRIFAPDGTAIGHIDLPERCANLCFGGPRGNRLLMASTTSLYSLFVNTRGA
ncbi:SMP-30/gluconolactonase/LRE family protein [Pseudomonas brassicacearum]|uniref:SMP-30/gluconolactonase/LRE family protein n=1 Tax=Pseudomonas brassicacearum subsp. neoaurantiaca TaxID=494916 RepID=A0A7V8UBE0_9PSED|nr:SMP-30/gluconolactonase/LRE family protein [Pseudomonas brassicacearum]MBA1376824.1 SMP-30/gluconolactonase/LRE family protein [Pseudomonas brassicacearum subsp. neoaurantiaca]